MIDATKISREAHALLRRAVPPNQLSALPAAAWWAPAAARREVGGYFDDGSAGGGGNQKWPDALAAAAEEGGKETKPLGLAAVGGCVSYLRRLLLDRQTVPLGNFTTWTPSDGVEATAAVRARPPVEPPSPPTPTAASTTTAAATSPPLTSLRPSVQARSLVLDSKAIDNLELFANSSDHGADGTLFKVLDKTASPFGKRLLRRWVCAPLRAVDEISERQDAVGALMGDAELQKALGAALRKVPDLERLEQRERRRAHVAPTLSPPHPAPPRSYAGARSRAAARADPRVFDALRRQLGDAL